MNSFNEVLEFEYNDKEFFWVLSMSKKKSLQVRLKVEGFYQEKVDALQSVKISSAIDIALSTYNAGEKLNVATVKKFKLNATCENQVLLMILIKLRSNTILLLNKF